MQLVKVSRWAQYPWLRHGFSTRFTGVSTVYGGTDLNLGFTRDDNRVNVEQNRGLFLKAIDKNLDPAGSLVTLRQVHGADVLTVTTPGPAGEADGLITSTPGLALGIQTADCVPVLVADTRQRIVAGFHAGWRGTAAAIVEDGVQSLISTHNSNPSDLVAAVGPAIGACCYTVGQEVEDRFNQRFSYAPDLFSYAPDLFSYAPDLFSNSSVNSSPKPTRARHVDLAAANRRQLLSAGLRPDSITVLAECTACSRLDGQRKFFSHRDEQGFTGRMMSVIAIAAD